MNVIGYIAIYVVTWAICLFVVLPWGVRSQSESDEAMVAGTERGAPARFSIWKKLLVNSVLAAVVVAIIYWAVSIPALQRYWG